MSTKQFKPGQELWTGANMTKTEKVVLMIIIASILFVLGSCIFLVDYLSEHKEEINDEWNKFKTTHVSITIQTQQDQQPETKQETP